MRIYEEGTNKTIGRNFAIGDRVLYFPNKEAKIIALGINFDNCAEYVKIEYDGWFGIKEQEWVKSFMITFIEDEKE